MRPWLWTLTYFGKALTLPPETYTYSALRGPSWLFQYSSSGLYTTAPAGAWWSCSPVTTAVLLTVVILYFRLIYYRPRWRLLILLTTAVLLTVVLVYSCHNSPLPFVLHCPACKSLVLFHKSEVKMDFDYRKYLNMSWNRQEPNTPLATLFTTWNPSMQRPIVYSNTLRTWSSIGAKLNTVVFTNNTDVSMAAKEHGWKNYSIRDTACFGTPVLRSMFQEAIRNERSILYGYSNADILFNDGLMKTLEAVTKSEEFEKGPILVVGKRIDVNISKLNEPVVRTTHEVDKLARHGQLSWGFAGDYFFTNDLFPWEYIPDLVVGRPLVDNWLIWWVLLYKTDFS